MLLSLVLALTPIKRTEKQNAVKGTIVYSNYLVHWKSLAKCNYICIYEVSEFAVVMVNLFLDLPG